MLVEEAGAGSRRSRGAGGVFRVLSRALEGKGARRREGGNGSPPGGRGPWGFHGGGADSGHCGQFMTTLLQHGGDHFRGTGDFDPCGVFRSFEEGWPCI